MSEETAPAAETPADKNSPPVQLSFSDLSAAVEIIDAAASRGAFRGQELSQVGGVRDRLSLFLQANLPPKEEESPEEDADPEQGD